MRQETGGLQETGVAEAVMLTAARHPTETAFATSRGPVSYGEFRRRVVAVTEGLRHAGLVPGDHCLFSVRPSVDAIVLAVAVVRAGGVLVFADPGMGPELFARRMATVPIRWAMAESLLYVASARGPLRWLLARRGLQLPYVTRMAVRHLRVGRRWPGVPRSLSLAHLQSTNAVDGGSASSPDGDVLVVFTSGTTAQPRAVVHTESGLTQTLCLVSMQLAMTRGDILYSDELHTILPALAGGATVCLPSRDADAATRLAEIESSSATHTFLVPSDLHAILEVARRTHNGALPASLTTILLGSAPVSAGLVARTYAATAPGTRVWCIYAMTEMLPVCVVEGIDKVGYAGRGDLVGSPVEGAEVSVNQDGEIVVAGAHLSRGIVGGDAVESHRTGDLGHFDDQGRVVLVGRKKEMIIRGHHNIYPGLYEPQFARLPGVAACAMVGVHSAVDEDERVVLVVEPDTFDEGAAVVARIREALRGQTFDIDAWAIPDAIFAGVLPRSGRSSKVDRSAVTTLAADLLSTATRSA